MHAMPLETCNYTVKKISLLVTLWVAMAGGTRSHKFQPPALPNPSVKP